MNLFQSNYFDIQSHQFSISNIQKPLLSQLLEMEQIKLSLSLPLSSKIIDFGCGSGRLSIYFLSEGYNITAVDISEKSLQNLLNIYKQYYRPGWGKLKLKKTLPRENYDGIIGTDILHHVEIKNILPRLYRVLKPGGKIAFSEPNALNIFWYIYLFLNQIPWKIELGITQNTLLNLNYLFKKITTRTLTLQVTVYFRPGYLTFPQICVNLIVRHWEIIIYSGRLRPDL